MNAQAGRLSSLESSLGGRFGVDARRTDNGGRLLHLCADHELFLASLQSPGVQFVAGANVVDLEYADDIVLIFEDKGEAYALLSELTAIMLSFGMRLSLSNCKVLLQNLLSLNIPLQLKILENLSMSRFIPPFNIPTSLQPSNFYTSDAKDAVFNFTGVRTTPAIVERSCAYAPAPPGSTLREKRKSESITPGSEEDVPPLKVYLSETAMSNHFAEMRLSTQDGECLVSTTPDRTSSQALTGADFDDLGLPVDQDTDQPADGGDDTPVFELSQCLKDHLKEFPPEYPKEKLLRKISDAERDTFYRELSGLIRQAISTESVNIADYVNPQLGHVIFLESHLDDLEPLLELCADHHLFDEYDFST
ncbi:hypothetical protein T265_01449 [Opisthorchis viverrini]|uniref:Reverse transcriptase domain-containing protein n=1 Tax=Opisthorchis viverrini TaxID=6198 RepID=A0A075AJ12_OPIVI|nr:hypothetical protein T265_01449 [Opisthorchis viverrini]KER32579.1 hypothetical protein T265_01449 [Opisthorchis viverrini]